MKTLLRFGVVIICLLLIIYFALITRYQYYKQTSKITEECYIVRINRLTGKVDIWIPGINNGKWCSGEKINLSRKPAYFYKDKYGKMHVE